jgi:oxygen-independent coproporphyrinogen-3 oxidase
MYTEAMERLEAAGFVQYEISNAARPGRESRHNLKYWTDGEWLGFGPGAHSTRAGTESAHRWKNVSATSDYIGAIEAGASAVAERRELSRKQAFEEAVFMGLRLAAGFDTGLVESRYGCSVWGQFGHQLQPFIDGGLLIYDGARMRLTRAGMLVANEVMAVFI